MEDQTSVASLPNIVESIVQLSLCINRTDSSCVRLASVDVRGTVRGNKLTEDNHGLRN
jgi:hypothetical protein